MRRVKKKNPEIIKIEILGIKLEFVNMPRWFIVVIIVLLTIIILYALS